MLSNANDPINIFRICNLHNLEGEDWAKQISQNPVNLFQESP